VAQHDLDRLHVRTGRDRQAGRCVPKLVRHEARDAARGRGPVKAAEPEPVDAEHLAALRGEQEIVGRPAGDEDGDCSWERYRLCLRGRRGEFHAGRRVRWQPSALRPHRAWTRKRRRPAGLWRRTPLPPSR
jgi:hypothetical protein